MTRPAEITERQAFIEAFAGFLRPYGTARAIADQTKPPGRPDATPQVGKSTVARLQKGDLFPRRNTVALLVDALDRESTAAWVAARDRVSADRPSMGSSMRSKAPDSALPRETAVLVGRAEQINEIEAALQSTESGVPPNVLVSGMAGVGKTAFVIHVAHRVAHRFTGGCFYLDLHGYSQDAAPLDWPEALVHVLRKMGADVPPDPDKRLREYRERLAASPTLIILDNARTSNQVAHLLIGPACSRVVVTSRRHLPAIEGGSVTLSLDCLDRAEAVELLRSIVPADRLLGQDDNLLRVASLCGGLPLAVAILGAKLNRRKEWTVDYLADRVDDRHQLFRDLEDGERSVRAAFQLSYDNLSDDQRRFFRMLGIAPGFDIDPERAAAVAAVELGQADLLLEEFLDRNLLLQQTPGRYRLHDLLSDYAGQLAAADAAELVAARQRLLEWTTRTAAARAIDFLTGPSSQPGGGRVPSRDWFLHEHDNLVATVSSTDAWAMPEFGRSLSASLSRPLLVVGYYEDALAVAECWLAAAHEPGDLARARLASGLAKIHLGRRSEALSDCRTALASFELAGDLAGKGAALKEIGNIFWYEGKYGEALHHYYEALPLQRTAEDDTGEAATLSNIGAVQSQLGRHPQALEDYGRALAIRRRIGDRVGMAQTLNNLGLAHERLGSLDDASTALTEALDLGRLLFDRALVCAVRTNLGNVYRRMRRFDEGTEHLEEAIGLAQELRSPRLEAEAENCLGDLLFAAGRNDDARESYDVALGLSADGVDREEEAHALEGLGLVHEAARRPAAAAHRWRSAAALYRELELHVELARVEGFLGRRP